MPHHCGSGRPMQKQNRCDRCRSCEGGRTGGRPRHQHLESVWSKLALDAGGQLWGRTIGFRRRVPQIRERRKRHHRQRDDCGREHDRKPRGHGRGPRWMRLSSALVLRLCGVKSAMRDMRAHEAHSVPAWHNVGWAPLPCGTVVMPQTHGNRTRKMRLEGDTKYRSHYLRSAAWESPG